MDGYSEQGQYGDNQMQFNEKEYREEFGRQEQQYDSELGFALNGDGGGNEMRDSIGHRDPASGSVMIYLSFGL